MKLTVFVPKDDTQKVLNALYAAGAGNIGQYKNCSFRTEGVGTFKPTGMANPHIGFLNKDEEVVESRVEVIFPSYLEQQIITALKAAHPYEEVAYYLHLLENEHQEVGSGMIGELNEALDEYSFLKDLKGIMNVSCVKHTAFLQRNVKKVAVCGGAGSFLLGNAIAAGADVYITSDYKYHDFFDADGKIVIADIGHYESEQFTIDLICESIKNNFPVLPVFSTKNNTNPVNYL
jgi:hypothetical protein